MVEMLSFQISYSTKKGDAETTIRAFNRQQAKRKLLSQVSSKYDEPVIKKIQEIG